MLTKLKKLRMEKGFHQDFVSKEVGISPSLLSKIENGRYLPSKDLISRFSVFYGEDESKLSKAIEKAINQKWNEIHSEVRFGN